MFKEFSVGQTVVVEIEGNSLIGEIKLIGQNGKRLKLCNVSNLKKEKYSGDMNVFASEVISINLLKSKYDTENSVKLNALEEENYDSDSYKKIQQINRYDIIENSIKQFIYIKQTDKSYHDAVKDLKYENKIGFTIESCKMGRNSNPTTIITLYSPSSENIYIFDIKFLGGLHPELKDILIQRHPIKIIFDSRSVADHLHYRYNIEINGIFDTFIGHLTTTKINNEISFTECCMIYFNLPKNYFEADKVFDWHNRPLEPQLMSLAAKKAILNYMLYQVILDDGLLKNFYDVCKTFSTSFSKNIKLAETAIKYSCGDKEACSNIINTDMNLSIDLNELYITKKD